MTPWSRRVAPVAVLGCLLASGCLAPLVVGMVQTDDALVELRRVPRPGLSRGELTAVLGLPAAMRGDSRGLYVVHSYFRYAWRVVTFDVDGTVIAVTPLRWWEGSFEELLKEL